METLSRTDLRFIVSRLPRDVRKELMTSNGLAIAGGFIRETIAGEKPNDIDIFIFGQKDAEDSKRILEFVAQSTAMKRSSKVYKTGNAFSVFTSNRMPIQFIHRWFYNTPEDILLSLDFTVCQAVVWFDRHDQATGNQGTWKSLCVESFYADLAARRLVYTHPCRDEEAGGSMLRVRKFIKRGYSIQCESLAGVVARLVSAVRGDTSTMEPMFLTKIICGLLREVDPMIAIDGLEPIDEHQTIEELSNVVDD